MDESSADVDAWDSDDYLQVHTMLSTVSTSRNAWIRIESKKLLTKLENDDGPPPPKQQFLGEMTPLVEALQVYTHASATPETSKFDEWTEKWGGSVIPSDEYQKLADMLCNPNPTSVAEDTSEPQDRTITARQESSHPAVSWHGISVEWFLETFMQYPEVRRLREFGCRMWFVRNFGITAILRARGMDTRGTLIDRLRDLDEPTAQKQDVFVNNATTFVSYTGACSLEHFAEHLGNEKFRGEFIWTDVFCVDQFVWNAEDLLTDEFKDQFMQELRTKIGHIGNSVLLLDRWGNIMGTLGKIWVLWEVFATIDGGARLEILFREEDRLHFIYDGIGGDDENFEAIRSCLSSIDCEEATAYRDEDRRRILSMMEITGKFNVNKAVTTKVREWLLETAFAEYHRRQSLGESASALANNLGLLCTDLAWLQKAEHLFKDAIKHYTYDLGADHQETIGARSNLAELWKLQGKFSIAEQMLIELLQRCMDHFGRAASLTLSIRGQLASVLSSVGRLSEGAVHFREILSSANPDDDPLIIRTKVNLAVLLSDQHMHRESNDLYREVIERLKHRQNHKDRRLLACMNNLADNLLVQVDSLDSAEEKKGLQTEAESLLREAAKGYIELHGLNHPSTSATMNNLGDLLRKNGNTAEAERLYGLALSGFQSAFGEKDQRTLVATSNLAIVLEDDPNKRAEAEAMHLRTLELRRQVLPPNHLDTLSSLFNLGSFYADRHKNDRALDFFEEALAGYSKWDGEETMEQRTRESIKRLRNEVEG